MKVQDLPQSVVSELTDIHGVTAVGNYTPIDGHVSIYCDHMISVSHSDIYYALVDSGYLVKENDVHILGINTDPSHEINITLYINPELFD